MKKCAAIVGIGETRQGKLPGMSTWDMYCEAAKDAIADAGIDKNEIDGLITCDSFITPHSRQHLMVAQYLGIKVRNHNDTSFLGGDQRARERQPRTSPRTCWSRKPGTAACSPRL